MFYKGKHFKKEEKRKPIEKVIDIIRKIGDKALAKKIKQRLQNLFMGYYSNWQRNMAKNHDSLGSNPR